MTNDNFTPTAEARPPDGVLVECIAPSGTVRKLIYEHHLWWLPSRDMYVYFTPVFWRPLT